jgi:signal transduction histidine kinase/CheY-like chemotaxis protein
MDSSRPRAGRLRQLLDADPARALGLGAIASAGCLLLIAWNLWGLQPDLRIRVAIAASALAGALLLALWAVARRALRRSQSMHLAEQRERRALEDKLHDAQRLESLNVLAGGIAHDFNNLLTGILSNAGTARRKLAANDSAQQHLSEIVRGSKLAAHLTSQLLAYAGRGQFQLLARDLSAEVREIQDLLETSVRMRARLVFRLADDLPAILADPIQIHQVLMNLVVNASESNEGGVEVRIETSAIDVGEEELRELAPGSPMKPGRAVALDVSDDGGGMDAATLARIFDPFFTTKAAGRGLGLAASLGIVHRHGGGIRVRSQPGQGTQFRVVFPASDQLVRAAVERPVTDLSGHGVVLVVDDDDYILHAVYVSLESFGYSVLLANSGAAALRIFEERSEQIDLVLLDMLMPGMSGADTFRALRAIRPDVKVLMSTGFAPDEAAQRFNDEGLAGFLRKPYDPDQLAGEVQRIIERGGEQPGEQMDEALRDLRAAYREKLPEQLDELEAQLRAARAQHGARAFAQACEIAHRICGTAGSYGLDDIAAEFGRIDEALREVDPARRERVRWRDIDAAVARIRQRLRESDGP